jgi:hypothetical protein
MEEIPMFNLKNSLLALALLSGATLRPTYDGPDVIIFSNQTRRSHKISIKATYDKNSKKSPNPSTIEIQISEGNSYTYTNFNPGLNALKLKLDNKPMKITYYNPGNKYMWPTDYSDLNYRKRTGAVAKIFLKSTGDAEFLYPTFGERIKYWFIKKFTRNQ